jgi:hypothetical protein
MVAVFQLLGLNFSGIFASEICERRVKLDFQYFLTRFEDI